MMMNEQDTQKTLIDFGFINPIYGGNKNDKN